MLISELYKKRLKKLSGVISEGKTSSINELDVDSVKIPTTYIQNSLNPKVWDNFELKPEIREKLLKIAHAYIDYLDVPVAPEKIMFLGSMANFNWTESSDFDLHIVYDFKKISDNVDLAKEFFDTKGSNWKKNHEISLKGYTVEVYVQEKEEENKSIGVFDLNENKWIHKPEKENVTIDKKAIKKKAADIATRIEDVEKLSKKESDSEKVYKEAKKIKDKIKKMRQSGLDKTGEFSVENLAFKYLRNNGFLERLGNIETASFDKSLSIDEAKDVDPRYLKKVIFKNKRRPEMIIVVSKTSDGRIVEIDNKAGIKFPFSVGQILNMGHETWACNNNFFVNDKDTCPEEKVMGIKKSLIPHGHPIRMMYPGKFKNESEMKEKTDKLPSREELEIRRIAKKGNLDVSRYDMNQLIMGYKVEKEHGTINPITNVTNDDEVMTLKIALAHLNEVKDYYTKLKNCVESGVSESLTEIKSEDDKPVKHKLVVKKSVDNLDSEKIKLIEEFIIDCCKELKINKPCHVYMTGERGGPITTTASYNPGNDQIWIYTKHRNMLADPLRSLAHEIRHYRQKLDGVLNDKSGEDGSNHENEANSFSGYMIRKFGRKHREIYK